MEDESEIIDVIESVGNRDVYSSGLASCNIFNNELVLECKCSPTSNKSTGRKKKSKAFDFDEQRVRVQPKVSDSIPPPSVRENQLICSKPSAAGSNYPHEMQSIALGNSNEIGAPPADFVHEKSFSKSSSKITFKPLKQASSSPNLGPVDEMVRLYEKYIETKNATPGNPAQDAPAPDAANVVKAVAKTNASRVALHFRGRLKKAKKKNDCLNENILTETAPTPPPLGFGPKRKSIIKDPFRFLKKRSGTEQSENQVQPKTESAADPTIEKKESAESDPPTVISGDGSNSVVDTMLSPDDASISVFEMFDQYSGGGPFRGMSCSPRLHSPVNQFEINKQAELLHQIEQLQKQLSNTKDTVKDLTAELDEVYSEKDVAL